MNRKTLVAMVAIGLGAVAAPASAHVTLNPSQASKGGVTKFAFRVPNESPDSATVKVEVSFPVDHPLAHLDVLPVAGWTSKVERQKLATPVKAEKPGEEDLTEYISKVTWEGGTIAPGQSQEFEVSGGPLPDDADEIVFKVVQTSASGEVVRWIEEPGPSGEEPEFPAPVLKLVAEGEGAPAGATTEPTTEPTSDTTETTAAQEEQAASSTDGGGGKSSNGLGVFALVVAGVALVLFGGALLKKIPTRE